MYRHIPKKRAFGWADMLVLATVAMLIYGIVGLAREWGGQARPYVAIDLSPSALPTYAFFSLMRAFASYLLSLGFSLAYGYTAAKWARSERFLIPLLDILQAIPVLGFMPGLVLGLVSLFPNSNVGVELTCIIMIFTGQAWNMCFSFYSSLKTVPVDLWDVAKVVRLSWIQRIRMIELPFSAIGLAWNSLMSMAGGWFFLTVCESFALGDRKFQVPGIGSYMATAIEQGDRGAMVCGVAAMFVVIIFVDFLVWRPVMAWVRKFQMEEIQEDVAELPFVTTLLRESWIIRRVKVLFVRRARRKPEPRGDRDRAQPVALETRLPALGVIRDRIVRHRAGGEWLLRQLGVPITIALCAWGGIRLWEVVRTLTGGDWRQIWGSVGLTFVRIVIAVGVASLWAIPAGILIGLSPRLTRIFQPVVQIAASFPMPMLFPIVLAVLVRFGIGLHWGSAVLMLLGVQWYILFNVLAGAMGITRDLKDSMRMMGVSWWTRWWRLYLPAAFPSLVTGWITAAGGAWNASIVAEYVQSGGKTQVAPGIGSMITKATASANFPLLAGCLIAMVIAVVGLNRTWWRWLSDLAETRFRFER